MLYETLLISIDNSICTITINRPENLNAINTALFIELADVLDQLAKDKDVRAVIITGAGEKAFVAGADIKEMNSMTREDAEARTWKWMDVYDVIRRLPKPVVASINGYALGGGMLLAISCDVRIAADTAQFGYPEIKLGIFPGTGGTILLDKMIGPAATRTLCLTGEMISAERAYQLGIVNQVVPPKKLTAVTQRVAATLASYSPVALCELKHSLNASFEQDFATARIEEAKAYGRCFDSEDRKEGIRAFMENRKPNFIGR